MKSPSERLEISNELAIELGGILIGREFRAEGRPLPPSKSFYGIIHELGGALSAGEKTSFRDYIGLLPREAELAANAPAVRIEPRVLNVAELEMKPLGSVEDPYGIWA